VSTGVLSVVFFDSVNQLTTIFTPNVNGTLQVFNNATSITILIESEDQDAIISVLGFSSTLYFTETFTLQLANNHFDVYVQTGGRTSVYGFVVTRSGWILQIIPLAIFL
jgi:hypothetical protein